MTPNFRRSIRIYGFTPLVVPVGAGLRALLQAEANEVLGDATIAPDYETTAKLALFDGAAFEALRFKPVTPVIGLEANQDFVLGDIFLPAGTQVFLCSRPAMMDDRYFVNAKEFEPSRWSRRSEGTTSRQAFTQFGAGPRVCPGRSLAIREIRMVLSMRTPPPKFWPQWLTVKHQHTELRGYEKD